jgi:hypothetical protein
MSNLDQVRAQEQLLQKWVQAELAAKSQSTDFKRYLKLLLDGPIISVFVSNGPPR